jgi:uncharacterized membrane protein
MVAFLFELGGVIFKRDDWRIAGFWCIILGALATIPAVLSGLSGGNGWFGGEWSNREYSSSLGRHRTLALIASAVALVLAIWRVVRRDKLRGPELMIYIVLLGATVGVITVAGYLGGYTGHGY